MDRQGGSRTAPTIGCPTRHNGKGERSHPQPMTTTSANTWSKALSQPAREFMPTPLPAISGAIPEGLRGTLYRNGPARLERGGMRVGHWFDGDGAILAVHFNDSGATGVYRYVKTAGYLEEQKAGKLLYGNYGMRAPGAFWNQWRRAVKNSANTSVLALPDKLLALWEGGKPHALDPQNLETWGTDDLMGLKQNFSYSAHPQQDPDTGNIYNFGLIPGATTKLTLYQSDRTGRMIRTNQFPLEGLPLVHSFVMAGRYLVFFVPPVLANTLPVLLGMRSYSNSMEWKPERGTQILVFDRETLSLISQSQADPWYQWHFANGYEDEDGTVVIDFARYEDFVTNQRLKEVATGQTQTVAVSKLWRSRLDPKTGKIVDLHLRLDRDCEFPTVAPHLTGRQSPDIYLSLHRRDADIKRELYGAIARYHVPSDTLIEADFGENRYPTEPIYAPDAIEAERGWVLTVVYDGNTDKSEVWIFDRDRLDAEPTCRLELPSVVPIGFHGTWKSSQ